MDERRFLLILEDDFLLDLFLPMVPKSVLDDMVSYRLYGLPNPNSTQFPAIQREEFSRNIIRLTIAESSQSGEFNKGCGFDQMIEIFPLQLVLGN